MQTIGWLSRWLGVGALALALIAAVYLFGAALAERQPVGAPTSAGAPTTAAGAGGMAPAATVVPPGLLPAAAPATTPQEAPQGLAVSVEEYQRLKEQAQQAPLATSILGTEDKSR